MEFDYLWIFYLQDFEGATLIFLDILFAHYQIFEYSMC